MQETQEMWAQSLCQEDPLKEEMATHSSVLAWKFSWAAEPGALQSTGSQRVRHDWIHGMQSCLLFRISNNWTSYIDFWFWWFSFSFSSLCFLLLLTYWKVPVLYLSNFEIIFFFFGLGNQLISECTLLSIWLSFFHNFVFLVFGYNIFYLGTLKLYLKFSSASWKLFV